MQPFFTRAHLPTPSESSVSDYDPDEPISPMHNPYNPDTPRGERCKVFTLPPRNIAESGKFFFAARVVR